MHLVFVQRPQTEAPAHLRTTMAKICSREGHTVDAAVASIVSEMENIFHLKVEQRTAVTAFFSGEDVFDLLSTGFGRSLI